ncbi:MAG TPA: hypothetical protein VJ843_05785 [Candidatus Saccharimonadales bacterium]|nr:hypothetical protein [Candidatus Saccharimonadales bacterium]
MNHEDLLDADRAVVEGRMMGSPDDFAAWEAELYNLAVTPAPTPEDERNKEKLSKLFDQPAFTETTQASTEVPPRGKRERLDETRGLLHALAGLAESKPSDVDTVDKKDPNYKKIRDALVGMGKGDDEDLIEANYLREHGGASGKQMQAWNQRKKDLIVRANTLLEDHPEQSDFFIMQGRALENNAAAYHDASSGKKSTWDQASDKLVAHDTTVRRHANDPTVNDADLVPAMARVNARDSGAAYQGMRKRYQESVQMSDNYNDLLSELNLDYEDGGQRVADFLQDFETRQGRNINEAVRELNEGTTFRAFLEAGPGATERAKAEQPVWRDIVFTSRAAEELQKQLAQMRANGMSTAHSHYREMNAKFAEVQRAHISSWQRWQNIRQQRAAAQNPLGKPDFQGRRPVFVAGDQGKGLYLTTGPNSSTTVIYPDYSMCHVVLDAKGVPDFRDRIKLDGTEWVEPEPVTLTYEEAAPLATTAGVMGHVTLFSTGVARATGLDKSRIDHRDIPALSDAYQEANFQVGMHPANHSVLKRAYDTTCLLQQRVEEQIATLEAIDPAAMTPSAQASLQTMLQTRGALQARAKYLEHGSKDNLSTMNFDASINFRGTMYAEERARDWRVAVTGDAVKLLSGGAQQVYRADGTRV